MGSDPTSGGERTPAAIGGWHAVAAALHARRAIEVLIAGGRRDGRVREIERLAQENGVPLRPVEADELDRLLPGVRHQGCGARIEPAPALGEGGLLELVENLDRPLLLVLDGVQDPHNLGACLRSAAAAGVHAVVVPKDRAAGLTPAVRKVAAGGAELVPLARVTNLARILRQLQEAGVWVVGAAAEAESPLYDVDLTGPLALALGGEESGLRHLTARTCDTLASIPMPGGVASLNVSVAAGICLFEALRQRGG